MNEDIIEVRNDLMKYLPKLEKGLMAILNKFKNEKESKAFSELTDALEGFTWILNVAQIIEPDLIDIFEFNDILETLLDAIENKDIETISDVIEFELIDLVIQWQEELETEE